MNLTNPSTRMPAKAVAIKVPKKDERLAKPTAVTEKLYGGPLKICDSVIAIMTNQLIQMVSWKEPQITKGEPSILKGAKTLFQKSEEL